MSVGQATMGPNAVSDPNALIAALRSQAPPSNPGTPLERINPDQQALEHIKAASVSLERATQFTNDSHMLLALNAMSGVLTKALLRFDGQAVLQALQEAVQSSPPAVGPAPGTSPPQATPQGMAGAPAAPQVPGQPGFGAVAQ